MYGSEKVEIQDDVSATLDQSQISRTFLDETATSSQQTLSSEPDLVFMASSWKRDAVNDDVDDFNNQVSEVS